MGFGTDYAGMTDREILIDMAGRLEVLEQELATRRSSKRDIWGWVANGATALLAAFVAYCLGKLT